MNKETFKQTYLPLSASMYRTAYRILGNPEDAEDMVQEAYMKLWKQRDTLDGILRTYYQKFYAFFVQIYGLCIKS